MRNSNSGRGAPRRQGGAGGDDVGTRFTDEQLCRAAHLYYVDALPQGDVARLMRVSQPQVSRMITLARERGIVQISVRGFDPRDREKERLIQRRFGLRDVVIIKGTSGLDPADAREMMAHFAAEFIAPPLSRARSVAVGGGRSVAALVRALQGPETPTGLVVVQAMGHLGAIPDSGDSVELARIVATRWGGTCQLLNSPAFLPDSRTRNAFLALDQIQTVRRCIQNAEMALIGVGTPRNSVFVEREVLQPADFARLQRSGAVGEICGRYYDCTGTECATPYRERVLGLELDDLRQIPNVTAVVAGEDRGPALHGALNGGLLKSLVLDETAAAALCESAGKIPAAAPSGRSSTRKTPVAGGALK